MRMPAQIKIPKGHTPIVNHMNFNDQRIGTGSTVYNPDGSMQAGPLPNGPPRNVSLPGALNTRDVVGSKGPTNKRF